MSAVMVPVETCDGVFWATYSPRGLAKLHFPGTPAPDSAFALPSPWHELTQSAVRAVLAGEEPGPLPPLDLEESTPYRRAIWIELQKIPLGSTITYGELAERLGKKGGSRAAGGACGANPIPLLIPCHRVVAAGNRLGGFSGGLDWKIRLLEREGALVRLADRPTAI